MPCRSRSENERSRFRPRGRPADDGVGEAQWLTRSKRDERVGDFFELAGGRLCLALGCDGLGRLIAGEAALEAIEDGLELLFSGADDAHVAKERRLRENV